MTNLFLVMITGDQALTACRVASQVHIMPKSALILVRKKTGEGFQWVSPDETKINSYSENEVEALSDSHDLCIGGDCFEMLQRTEAVLKVIPYIKVARVFARVAPEQKELILPTFKTVGRMTLMCGDGTNNVGALKQDFKVLLLLYHHLKREIHPHRYPNLKVNQENQRKPKPMTESSHSAAPPNSSTGMTNNHHLTAAEKQHQKLRKMWDEMNEEGDGRAPPLVKLGDASMASPFTAKHASVVPTLVKETSKLPSVGSSLLLSSFSSPMLALCRHHPLLGPIPISFVLSLKYMPEECIEPDFDFHPNLVNIVSYMVNMVILVATFAANYMGHPCNQSISENKPFQYALFAAVGFFTVITSDLCSDLNDWLKLEPLPDGMGEKLMLWAAFMFLGCYGWERLLRWGFSGTMPAWKSRQRQATGALEKKCL
ncbi:putative manganese-transporting ATPase PDR2 [Cocos nucifera]|uniref:Putative manganese-transporting ATPase PDR2 n=1 Tax=Cocos nucifera TaxID=13894 RepID=A0A8K0HW81_COCNU|nr:putative manganese-transporting ATPase PDR2 [Cocos nucifera]